VSSHCRIEKSSPIKAQNVSPLAGSHDAKVVFLRRTGDAEVFFLRKTGDAKVLSAIIQRILQFGHD
jgi:hypothetical protein